MAEKNTREQKQAILKQKGHCIWLTGLPGSGKTTIATELEKLFIKNAMLTKIFDGDIIRSNINSDLDFSEEGRMQNIIRVAQLNAELISCGMVVINAFVSPLNSMRDKAIEIIGKNDFTLVFVDCPQTECEKRDPKGMYAKARAGRISNFTGVNDYFEEPVNPDLTINTAMLPVDESVDKIFSLLFPLIKSIY